MALLGRASTAGADTSGRAVLEVARTLGSSKLLPSSEKQSWVVRVPDAATARASGLIPIVGSWAVARGMPTELSALSQAFPDLDLRWAPPRATSLDQATRQMRLAPAEQEWGLTGQGVIVGTIDTGADITHPAFRNEDGTTRISWYLSFDQKPLGLHPELEEEYGCTIEESCAVLAKADLDVLLSRGASGLRDRVGHGTHVLSTAAGSDKDYPGIAPGADLVVVQAGGGSGNLNDADILLGARFIFDRAAESQQPAVINVSLGSSFGAHDGSTSIEQGLAELSRGPGRAVVVAAGNDGRLYRSQDRALPEPLGIHTEVDVPVDSPVRVSLVTPGAGEETLTGAAYVWISTSPGDDLQVAFDSKKGSPTSRVASGEAAGFKSRQLGESVPVDYEVAIFNGIGSEGDLSVQPGNVVVVVVGAWKSGSVFDLILTGRGFARIWIESGGEVGPGRTGTGLLLPRARVGGTVGVPASHPELIAVGASMNRSSWVDVTGATIDPESEVGSRAVFSSAGPNRLGNLKPDLLAPGAYLVAAMSEAADPRNPDNGVSQFQSTGLCTGGTPCLVVDDLHAVSSGTSMSSPVVAGAVALLFQRDPQLTQADARRLLRAGTQSVPGETGLGSWSGTGALDVVGTLRVQDLEASGALSIPTRENSRMVLANTFISPREGADLSGLMVLRNSDDEPAGGFEPERLRLDVRGGTGRILSVDAGLLQFSLTAPPGRGGQELTASVLFDEAVLAKVEVPVGADPFRARQGFDAAGGCAWRGSSSAAPSGLMPYVGAVLIVVIGRRRKRPA